MARSGGSLPASVYWRRRAVVFGGLLVIVAVVVLIVVRPGFGGIPPVEEPVAQETLEVIAAPNCLPSQLELTAMTDQSTYAPGQAPQLWLTVKNTSAVECTVNVGTDVQRYVITSGDDQIWASDDCQKTSLAAEQVLAPGEEQGTMALAWDRTRSTPDTCDDAARPTMPGGGASYHLRVYLGDLQSAQTKQFLLD